MVKISALEDFHEKLQLLLNVLVYRENTSHITTTGMFIISTILDVSGGNFVHQNVHTKIRKKYHDLTSTP